MPVSKITGVVAVVEEIRAKKILVTFYANRLSCESSRMITFLFSRSASSYVVCVMNN